MVSTRSHDHASEDVDANDQTDGTPSSVISKKRKIEVNTDATPAQHVAKRRRSPARAVAVVIDRNSPKRTKGSSPVNSEGLGDTSSEVENLHSQTLESNLSTTSKEPPTIVSQAGGDKIDAERTFEIKNHTHNGSEEVRGVAKETLDKLIAAAKGTKAVEPRESENEWHHEKQGPSKEAERTVPPAAEALRHEIGIVKPIKAPKATHKRFGSEDVEASELQLLESSGQKESEESNAPDDADESEDDAPDTVTAAAGYDQVRAAAAEAARVAGRQDADQRTRRRELDQRLKSQAKSAKKHSKSNIKTKFSGNDPIPAYLPDEILAAEPIVRPPAPPSSVEAAVPNKRKFLETQPRLPKDVKRGNTKIRILKVEQTDLPPKSTTASRKVREAWLTGQRGLSSGVGVPRRKPSGGFVRR